jgi:putative transposase
LTPHPVYSALAAAEPERLVAYRAMFRPELDADAIGDICMALDQGQVLGDSRFLADIEWATGERRKAKPRGRPRKPVVAPGEEREQLAFKI